MTKKATPKAPAKKAAVTKNAAPAKKLVGTNSKRIKKVAKAVAPIVEAIVPLALTRSASKKEMVEPKLAKMVSAESDKALDFCLLLDCTGSMDSWIERSKNTLKEIIDNVKRDNPELLVRVCFVGYRDIKDKNRFEIMEFRDNLEQVKAFITTVRADNTGN